MISGDALHAGRGLMKLEKCPAPLEAAARQVFEHAFTLSGVQPRLGSNGWYRCSLPDDAPWADIYLCGDKATKNPPRSILAVAPESSLLDDDNSEPCDYWYGSPARCYLAKVSEPDELSELKQFLELAHASKK